MKANEVLKLLGITRTTLYHYVKSGKITYTVKDNGYYDYDKASVVKLLDHRPRVDVIYARVSTHKQKNDLKTQVQYIESYCKKKNIIIDRIYQDIASGVELERPEFSLLLDDVMNYNIGTIYISYRDRLSRLSFKVIDSILKRFGTSIIIVSDVLEKKELTDDQEYFEDILSLMHHFSTKLYSNRHMTTK